MCLLVLAWHAHPRYRLIVAANRDEFHERPASPLAQWSGPAGIIAGRDLRAGGTWLGVDARLRLGVITNFRDLQKPREGAPSRGALIPAYLQQQAEPEAFFAGLARNADEYAGFNLLLADADSLWYGSNRAQPFARPLTAGVYGLSNELLDTPWPKLVRVRRRFESWLHAPSESPVEELFAMLSDRVPGESERSEAPSSIAPELWRALSAPFVHHPTYGTRCSTVVLIEKTGALSIVERRFDAGGNLAGEVRRVR
jgi:uncharacterized protein with NRDE domain